MGVVVCERRQQNVCARVCCESYYLNMVDGVFVLRSLNNNKWCHKETRPLSRAHVRCFCCLVKDASGSFGTGLCLCTLRGLLGNYCFTGVCVCVCLGGGGGGTERECPMMVC